MRSPNPQLVPFKRHRFGKQRLPKPIKLGLSAVGWLEHEINAWVEKLITQRED
ncbi:helix-turn-helix transcriptional regulator [Aeromonas veronii]|uniref:helix-turn-helix transcriptional regulator n=1 Tax=Aeromonas veronii TaxID=654 RepID=UPI0022377FAD|nr:AlpA family phage regulatory protein [Aeromonas veronii]